MVRKMKQCSATGVTTSVTFFDLLSFKECVRRAEYQLTSNSKHKTEDPKYAKHGSYRGPHLVNYHDCP